MPSTITDIGRAKQARRFAESISHAEYEVDGVPGIRDIFRTIIEGDMCKLYVFFDDGVTGNISEVRLIDVDGDVICRTDKIFLKSRTKGLYVAFKYRFTEVESVESI